VGEHLGMRDGTGDILRIETLIKTDRGCEFGDEGICRAFETATP
jgi:hypothetical protein